MTKYYSDPDYKAKHNAYMVLPITCECSATILRCNISKHRASKKHAFMMALYEKCTPFEIKKYLDIKKSVEKGT